MGEGLFGEGGAVYRAGQQAMGWSGQQALLALTGSLVGAKLGLAVLQDSLLPSLNSR